MYIESKYKVKSNHELNLNDLISKYINQRKKQKRTQL